MQGAREPLARRSVDPADAVAQERPYLATRLSYTRRAYGVDRMRPDTIGGTLWAGGTLRAADGGVRVFAPDQVRFTPWRTWRSPRTGVAYPVAMAVGLPGAEFLLEPIMDDQELDSRASTGTIYWEGAVRALQSGREAGRGYLELTGYGAPLRF